MFETITDRKANMVISMIVIIGTIIFAVSESFIVLYLTVFALYVATFKYSSEISLPKKIIVNTIGLLLLIALVYAVQILIY
ncbi:hypothetical protein A0126_19055 (plasmid) [Exiguobacterium sp. N4-1P]|uniref:hypothetical protein n=1 Tax=Exiguobacterium sp. N4-1P TaxID=2051906 RepID=UPI000B58982E|nr:hypothetical protein [Exiguobacterium sp. N4-1P]ASI36906.1 hypothetical protein A0126_15340 [Exiguobacterium sp. N4-1P]ASI37689.1 hypothetical protein A0126_19055 [Exiguobacterium sp. N4-1P]